MNIRLQASLIKYINGIDFALWNFYVNGAINVSIEEVENLSKKEKLTQSRKIEFSNKNSERYLLELSKKTTLSKSVIIRRCLIWLSKQPSYPTNFIE
jgi:hypothetical protein